MFGSTFVFEVMSEGIKQITSYLSNTKNRAFDRCRILSFMK